MNMNRIGKGLVLVHTFASIIALAWAAGLFLQFTDWGWKEPRSELGFRIPSEYDKRAAVFREAVKARDIAMSGYVATRAALREAQERFPENHLYYEKELARLRSSTEPIEVKAISKEAGPIVLDTPGKPIGVPVLDKKIEGITKSYEAYAADLKRINMEIDNEVKQIRAWTEKARVITILLDGKDDTGKVAPNTVGIYALLEGEKKAQDQARFEKDYLQPIWAKARERAEIFVDIRASLEDTLNQLRGKKK
jgi:hypothetical protein